MTKNCEHYLYELKFIKNIEDNKSLWECSNCKEKIIRNFHYDTGDISDGYHTFNELYHHRAILTSVIFNNFKEISWKSKKHDDGSMYDGMFIVGIDTPLGSATYHYDIDPYWDIFKIKELEKAPKWDGHTPDEAIKRIESLGNRSLSNFIMNFIIDYEDKNFFLFTPVNNKDNSFYCLNEGNPIKGRDILNSIVKDSRVIGISRFYKYLFNDEIMKDFSTDKCIQIVIDTDIDPIYLLNKKG